MQPVRTTPWLPPEAGRPLRAWSRQQLQALGTGLHELVRDWAAAWAIDDVQASELAPVQACHLDGCTWRELGSGLGPRAWLGLPQPGGDSMSMPHGTWARELAALGQADLLQRLGTWLGAGPDLTVLEHAPPPELGRPWSGAVIVTSSGPDPWRLVLDADAVARKSGPAVRSACTPEAQPVASALEALRARPIRLRVELRGRAVDLGLLQTLAPGDVVPLEHRLSEPACLTGAMGGLILAGYLGCAGRFKAVELAAPAAAKA